MLSCVVLKVAVSKMYVNGHYRDLRMTLCIDCGKERLVRYEKDGTLLP